MALVIGGCRGDLVIWTPSPPVVPEARAAIFVYRPSQPPWVAIVVEVVEGRPSRTAVEVPAEVEVPETGAIDAYYYEPTLEALGLAEGLLPGTSNPRPCALGRPIAAFHQAIGEATWAARSLTLDEQELQVILGAAPCQAPDRCQTLVGRRVELPSTAAVLSLTKVNDDRVLAGGLSDAAYFIDRDGTVSSTIVQGLIPTAGLLRRSGEHWLGGEGGRILVGRFGDRFEELQIPGRAGLAVAALSEAPDRDEVLVLSTRTITSTGPQYVALDRYDGQGWQALYAGPSAAIRAHPSTLYWLQSGEALALYRDRTYLHYDGQRAQLVRPDQTELIEVGLTSAVEVPDDPLPWIGGDDGRLYRLDLERRRLVGLDLVQLLSGIEVMLPYRQGAILGGENGLMLQVYPGAQPCAAMPASYSDAEAFLRLGDELVVAGGNPDERRNNMVTWVRLPPN